MFSGKVDAQCAALMLLCSVVTPNGWPIRNTFFTDTVWRGGRALFASMSLSIEVWHSVDRMP